MTRFKNIFFPLLLLTIIVGGLKKKKYLFKK